MTGEQSRALSDVLDQLEASVHGTTTTVAEVVEKLGRHSFASLMLIFSLISTSPASAIPGVTTMVAGIVFILVAQMILGRRSVWLPGVITRLQMDSARLCKGIAWLRPNVRFIERFVRSRLTFLFHRPWRWLPLCLILALTVVMPFLEFIPMSGSIASAVIAILAAGFLTRDGVLVVIALSLLIVVPMAIWSFGASV